jgi:hypothetical protein
MKLKVFALILMTLSPLCTGEARFGFSKEVVVLTTSKASEGSAVIVRVVHFKDGSWLFSNMQQGKHGDVIGVKVGSLVSIDTTLNQLADLPLGWSATREASNGVWVRAKIQ